MKKTKKEHTNSRGFSLIEIVIGLAVMGVIATGVATSMVQMSNNQKRVENRVDAGNITSGLSDYLKTEAFCNVVLIGKKAPSKDKRVAIEIADFGGIAAGKKIKDGAQISENVKIDKLYMALNKSVAEGSTMFKGSQAKELMLDIGLQSSRLEPGVNGEKWRNSPDKKFSVPVKVDASSRKIVACNHLNTAENACTAVGGKWTGSGAAAYCKPNAQCTNMGSYITWECTNIKKSSHQNHCGKTIKAGVSKGLTIIESKLKSKKKSGGVLNPYNKKLSCAGGKFTEIMTGKDVHHYGGLSCGKKCSYSIKQEATFYSCIKCK